MHWRLRSGPSAPLAAPTANINTTVLPWTPFSPLELPEAKIKQPKPMLNAGRQTSALNRNQIKQAPTNPLKVMKTEVFHFFSFFYFFFFIIKSQRMKKKGTGNQRGENLSIFTQRPWSLKPLISGHVHWDCLGCNEINQFVLTNVGGIMKIWGYVRELEASQESRDFSFSRSLSLSLCVCACVCILLPLGRPSFPSLSLWWERDSSIGDMSKSQ